MQSVFGCSLRASSKSALIASHVKHAFFVVVGIQAIFADYQLADDVQEAGL